MCKFGENIRINALNQMMQGKKVVAVIPARYASTRFPGKPLVELVVNR